MSRLSVHYNDSGNHTGFGDFLRIATPGFVYSLNGNIRDTVQRESPATKIVFRVQNDYWQRLPSNMFVGDPAQSATHWLNGLRDDRGRTLLDVWALNPADYYDPLNEPTAHTRQEAEWLNNWMLTALELANRRGFRLAMFSFGTANPPYESWTYLLPAMRLGRAYGAILSLHCYQDVSLLTRNPDGTYTEETLNQTLRHRRIYDQYVPPDAQLPILYSEASPDNGYGMGLSGDAWISDMGAYDTELFNDPYIVGICGFQLGGSESNLVGILARYAQYISEHPTEEPMPKLNIVVTENLIPQDTTQEELEYVHANSFKQDVLWSADTAKFLVSNALPGSKVIVWEPSRWTQGDIIAYLGVPTEIKHFPGYQPPPATIRLSNPVPSIPFRVTSPFNAPRSYANGKHEGLDLDGYDDVTRQVVPVVACAAGVVEVVNTVVVPNSYGKYIVIDHQNGFKTWYCHLSEVSVSVGQQVDREQEIGVTGTTGTSAIHLHLNLQHIGHGLSGYFVPDVIDPLPFIDAESAPPTPIADTYFGLGYGNQYEIPQSHADLYGAAFAAERNPAFLFLTLPDYGAMTRTIQKIKAKTPGAFLMARMFFSVGDIPFSPQDFVDYTNNGTKAAYDNGIRDFQPGNEWNIEGMGINWTNGVQFGNWLKQVLLILKARYPDARFWYPALSPNPAAQQFFVDSLSTGLSDMLYGYCHHNYWWTESGGQYNMVDETGGLQYKKFVRLLSPTEQKKPISITEFSCNTAAVSPYEKGRMYRRYRDILKQNGVHSAFSFVLNWDNDINKENWCNLNGGSTGIKEGFLA